ncbi:DUF996 domain-containing protein [Thermococcus pacificus]|uniref:DUF996 domain-containing protein n=1 Tax=Thermococcus pacificus TaxID=71998 RepID=A0A218P817_9EURY|nr:DUF996 domain-containing protein [Thermococcus pacificus]ASJ06935.1 hypothetical protein A3L08_06165 [Thermococcus pacificus]
MTVNLRSERNLGLIGSVLVLVGGFLGIIPYIGTFLGTASLVGQILILISLHGIGNKLGDDRPFRYYLYSIVVVIGALIIAAVMALVGILTVPSFVNNGDWTGLVGVSIIGMAVLLLLAALIIGIYFDIKAWRATYEITGVEEFDKVATWTMWGAITLIILVGAILLLVATIYQIIAFANLPEELEPKEKAISSPIA